MSGAAGSDDDSKWQRSQLKKLRQILVLKIERDAGALLNDAQRQKLGSEGEVRASLAKLGCDTANVENEAKVHAQVSIRKRKEKQLGSETAKRLRSTSHRPFDRSTRTPTRIGSQAARELRNALSQALTPEEVLKKVSEAASDSTLGLNNPDLQVHALFQVAKLEGRSRWRQQYHSGASSDTWASGSAWHDLLDAVGKNADRMDPQQLSKALWAAAKAAASNPEAAKATSDLMIKLQDQVPRVSMQLDGRGCSNILWGIATMAASLASSSNISNDKPNKLRIEESAMRALERSAQSLLPTFNSQDLANFVWAVAKLRWQLMDDTLEGIDAAAVRLVSEFRPQELSMTLLRLATAGHCPTALLGALPEHLCGQEEALGPQGLPNILWALAKFDAANASLELVEGLQMAAAAIAAKMTPQGVANTAFALGRLQAPGAKNAFAKILLRPQVLGAMSCQDIGDVLSAAGRLGIDKKHGSAAELLSQRVLQVVNDMGWQALGHLESALPVLQEAVHKLDEALRSSLKRQTKLRVHEVNGAAQEHDTASLQVMKSLLKARAELLHGRQALVVGMPKSSKMAAFVKKACGSSGKPAIWCRFCSGSTIGTTLPPKKKAINCAVVRVPVSKAALALTLQQLGTLLKHGEPLVLCGHNLEGSGARGSEAALAPFFELSSSSRIKDQDSMSCSMGGFAMIALRTKAPPLKPSSGGSLLEEGATETTLRLTSEELGGKQAVELPWTVYPALFAGGELDIMTTFLLRGLPDPPQKARVLDFCCGSGVIAAALLKREPSIRVDALDADSLACAAARANLPASSKVVCSDCWAALDSGQNMDDNLESISTRRYHWIVSNPPVHHGSKDDFSVIEALVKGSWKRLRKQGTLWIVAQAYIPLQTMAEIVGEDRKWTAIEVTAQDGRFKILRCDKGGGLPPASRSTSR